MNHHITEPKQKSRLSLTECLKESENPNAVILAEDINRRGYEKAKAVFIEHHGKPAFKKLLINSVVDE